MATIVDVTVIIVNHNAGEYLAKCLAALAAQTVAPKRVVVVDNASTDGSLAELETRYPCVYLIKSQENLGFAAANNLAVATAVETDWIALLNPDAFPEPDWLEAFQNTALANPEYSFFCCRMLKADDPTALDGAGDSYHVSGLAWRKFHGCKALGNAMRQQEVFAPCAAAALYRRAAFLEAGGFDEAYFCYMEDVDLAYRLRLLGHRCLYVPSAVVHHVGSGIVGRRSDFATYHGHRNLVWTYVKNMPGYLFWLYLPQHVLINIASIIWLGLRGQGRVILTAKRDALRQLPRVWRQRRSIQENRRVSAGELRQVMDKGFSVFAMCRCGF